MAVKVKGREAYGPLVVKGEPMVYLFFNDADHMAVFDDEGLLAAAPVNPLFLCCPFLLDDIFLAGFAQKENQCFLENAYFKTAVFETGFVGDGQVGIFLEVFVNIVRTFFYELVASARYAAAT
jgi:hypothetical protein